MQRTITRQMSFDLTKLLVTEDWFSDISPQTMRRLLNIVSVTGDWWSVSLALGTARLISAAHSCVYEPAWLLPTSCWLRVSVEVSTAGESSFNWNQRWFQVWSFVDLGVFVTRG